MKTIGDPLELKLKRISNTSFAFVVPSAFIKQGFFVPEKKYNVSIEELKESSKNGNSGNSSV